MTTPVATVDGVAAQAALRDMVGRLTAMLRTVPDPDVSCLGQWSLSEVALHLSQVWALVPGFARGDLSLAIEAVPSLSGTDPAARSLMGDMWEHSSVTEAGVASDPERDLRVLADRIGERAETFLAEAAAAPVHEDRTWLVEGAIVDRPSLTCHLLNETIVHGYDIARAAGLPWKIDRPYAALVLAGFIIPVIRAIDPRAFVDQERTAGLQATVDVHLRGGPSFAFIFDDGELHIESPADRRIDCHLSADPAAMLLVAWGRTSHWPAIAKGQLLAWGRKPWLGPRFPSFMRNP